MQYNSYKDFCIYGDSCQTITMLALKPGFQMLMSLYDPTPPPDYPYLRSISSYSAMVQLYCRAGQLPTASRLLSCNMVLSNTCQLGCDTLEDKCHIFVECPYFSQFQDDALTDIVAYTETKCTKMDTGICDEAIGRLLFAAKSLLTNVSSVWPLHCSTYYLGWIPDIATIVGPFSNIHPPMTIPKYNLCQRRFIHHIASEWHLRAIRLAGRIWGEVQRKMAISSGS
ncbi:hypothetical protein BDZ94DRAFT_640713 [Collybia nuda]|uniref:Uncharacterized protein n=1 Tax=Collybia nuda TaxID=64659 RepID=A0A9P5Y434_9AGAR|nr:hypothetical protein BDZ94DRAFT_640713 [Collybia nuda]